MFSPRAFITIGHSIIVIMEISTATNWPLLFLLVLSQMIWDWHLKNDSDSEWKKPFKLKKEEGNLKNRDETKGPIDIIGL